MTATVIPINTAGSIIPGWMPDFREFPKIARLSREIIVTEKIDGTNAQVYVDDTGQVLAGSRTRWITPEQDNYGFAKWVKEREDLLRELGPGRHYGEWWGPGIQRGYGVKERRFSLFNTSRWDPDGEPPPVCCLVVPVLYRGPFSQNAIMDALDELREKGSRAAPGFMRPEGVVIYHVAAGVAFKKTLEHDDEPKSAQRMAA